MSGLCGWIGYAASEEARRNLVESMGAELTRHGGGELETLSTIGCAMATASCDGSGGVCREQSAVAAIAGRPTWSDSRLAELAARSGDAAALAEGYLARGADVLKVLRGTYALAVGIDGSFEGLLAVDRLGTIPLTYSYEGNCLVFGTHGDALVAHPQADSEIDRQSIFNYFFFHQIPAPGTIRRKHRRLLPGHCLVLGENKVEVRAYTHPTFDEQPHPVPQLEEEFHALMRQAVGRCASGAEVGAFLSGGTDSSTIAGVLSGLSDAPARTYSIGFGAEGWDEMEFARCAAERFKTDQHEYYVTPDDVADAVPKIAAIHSDPFANESAVPTYFCARLAAQDGVTRMLAGDGGDELFGGNERYARIRVFERYAKVPRVARRLLEALLWHVPGGGALWPVRKARSYVAQARTPLPERLYTQSLLLSLGAERVFESEFLASIDMDAPFELARHVFRGAKAKKTLNKVLAYEYKFTLADNDLVKVNRSCELAGVEVAYPFLDDDLVDFAGRLPVGLKLRGKKLRWFFKHALRDFLPQEILTKSKHGFGLPFGVWLTTHDRLQQLAGDSIADLKGRGIIRAAFMDEILHLHRTEHASFYGVMVWMLVMLEQWFKAHEDQPALVR